MAGLHYRAGTTARPRTPSSASSNAPALPARPTPFQSPTGSRSSTMTAPCGVRSRCRSSSTSSCAGWPRWPRRDAELRNRQPWKAAYDRDYGWLASVIAEHYAGDDTNVPTLAGGILAAFANITVDEFEAQSDAFLRGTSHPTLGRTYLDCAYAPMVQLLGHLEANGFTNYIASGGGRDFMRPISDEVYGIPRERVIGSSTGLAYTPDESGGTLTRQAAIDYLDDGPEKPIHIWSRTGRRPVLAAGNSNGDIEMLDFTQHHDKPSPAPARAPRRPRTRVRLHLRRREGPRTRASSAAGRSSASRTTGLRSSEDVDCRTSRADKAR